MRKYRASDEATARVKEIISICWYVRATSKEVYLWALSRTNDEMMSITSIRSLGPQKRLSTKSPCTRVQVGKNQGKNFKSDDGDVGNHAHAHGEVR